MIVVSILWYLMVVSVEVISAEHILIVQNCSFPCKQICCLTNTAYRSMLSSERPFAASEDFGSAGDLRAPQSQIQFLTSMIELRKERKTALACANKR